MEPYDQLRCCVEELETFELKELTGMFCEYLQDALDKDPVDFSHAKFDPHSEEPYSVYYFWDFGDKTLDVILRSGIEGSSWSVVRTVDGKRKWKKCKINDFETSMESLVKELKS